MIQSLYQHLNFTLERIPFFVRLRKLDNELMKPKTEVFARNEFYEVKTASTTQELIEVLKLRFEIFHQEFSSKKIRFTLFPYDVDVFDFVCDHLIVKELATQKIVACYRLLQQNDGEKTKFYSDSEFDLSGFVNLPGKKVELGRACVHRDYRKGAVIATLWKGLLQYAKKSNANYLFGCSSLTGDEIQALPALLESLKERNAELHSVEIPVREKYQLPAHIEALRTAKSGGEKMPSLLHMYLTAGAQVGGNLAFDEELGCVDLFTVIDLAKLPASFERRFS